MNRLFDKKVIKAAFPKTIPVLTGYMVLGFGFGLLLQSKGYNFIWAFFMSLTIYAGSMQYVAIDLMSTGATLLSAGVMTLMINARHLFYGLSMLIKYRDIKKVKPYLIFGLTDETYSLLCTGEVPAGLDREAYYFWITAMDQSYWIIGSTLGALFGQAVPINTAGVDFAMTALFIVIFTDNLLKKESRFPAFIGAGISFISLMIFGASNFLIPSMILITVALLLFRGPLSKRLPENKKEQEGEEA